MKQAKILGYSISKEDHPDIGDHGEGYIKYTFYIELDSQYYSFSAIEDYGSCGSGYCGASWGNLDLNLEYQEKLPVIENLSNKDMFVNIVGNKIVHAMKDSVEYSDSVVDSVKLTDDNWLCKATGNGGCSYYPSGVVEINEQLFEL